MPKQPETAAETVPETAKQISIEMVRLFRPIALRPLRSGSALPSATLAAHRSSRKGGRKGQGDRGLKVARHRHEWDNARNSEAPGAAGRQSVAVHSERTALRVTPAPLTVSRTSGGRSNSLPGASQRCGITALASARLGPTLGPSASYARTSGSKINALSPSRHRFGYPMHAGKGISRASCHIPGSSLVGTARSRAAKCWRNVEYAKAAARGLGPFSRSRGVGGNNPARPIIDLSSIFRGPSEKNRVYK
jgi:hypothetical protein